MSLGTKLKAARMEAGLSQRQLCGERITRNMLSQIENGTAMPSMKTLTSLAERLGKPVSYFLEEEAVTSPNGDAMNSARCFYDSGAYAQALLALEAYREPDPVYDREKSLLWALSHIAMAEQALKQGRAPYALELLKKADVQTAYCSEEIRHRYLLILGRIPGQQVAGYLPSLDEELLLRAKEAMSEGNTHRAGALLDAAQDQSMPDWNLLRGKVCLARNQYSEAVQYLRAAEIQLSRETYPLLERCCRELGDYKRAYEYACKQREK